MAISQLVRLLSTPNVFACNFELLPSSFCNPPSTELLERSICSLLLLPPFCNPLPAELIEHAYLLTLLLPPFCNPLPASSFLLFNSDLLLLPPFCNPLPAYTAETSEAESHTVGLDLENSGIGTSGTPFEPLCPSLFLFRPLELVLRLRNNGYRLSSQSRRGESQQHGFLGPDAEA